MHAARCSCLPRPATTPPAGLCCWTFDRRTRGGATFCTPQVSAAHVWARDGHAVRLFPNIYRLHPSRKRAPATTPTGNSRCCSAAQHIAGADTPRCCTTPTTSTTLTAWPFTPPVLGAF